MAVAANRTHGMKGATKSHPLYRAWRAMKSRCYNPNIRAFKTYGARGISITPKWKDDPVAFVEWCLAHGWRPGLSINRIDNDWHYEPGNIDFISKPDNTRHKVRHERRRKRTDVILGALALPG
jgi:hypothetical protein